MTDNRTTELLPCPFCGGEAEIVALDAWYKNPFVGIGCSKCPAILAEYGEYKRFNTEAEAIAAWNTRAEQTCKVAASYDTADLDSRNSNAEWYFAFSCGCELYWDEPEPPKYCPECGARVIGTSQKATGICDSEAVGE